MLRPKTPCAAISEPDPRAAHDGVNAAACHSQRPTIKDERYAASRGRIAHFPLAGIEEAAPFISSAIVFLLFVRSAEGRAVPRLATSLTIGFATAPAKQIERNKSSKLDRVLIVKSRPSHACFNHRELSTISLNLDLQVSGQIGAYS